MIKATMSLQCPFGNKKYLIIRESDEGDLSYTLKGAGSTTFALENLQLKQPLPQWSDYPVDVLISEIERILHQGVYRHLGATVRRPRPAPDAWQDNDDFPVENWRDEVMNDDTRLGYLDWVEAGRRCGK